jgi:hypothetical protein
LQLPGGPIGRVLAVAAVRGAGEQITPSDLDALPVRQQLAGVVEEHDTVAQQAPPLLGVSHDDVCSVAVDLLCRGARWTVPADVNRIDRFRGSDHLFFPIALTATDTLVRYC